MPGVEKEEAKVWLERLLPSELAFPLNSFQNLLNLTPFGTGMSVRLRCLRCASVVNRSDRERAYQPNSATSHRGMDCCIGCQETDLVLVEGLYRWQPLLSYRLGPGSARRDAADHSSPGDWDGCRCSHCHRPTPHRPFLRFRQPDRRVPGWSVASHLFRC